MGMGTGKGLLDSQSSFRASHKCVEGVSVDSPLVGAKM